MHVIQGTWMTEDGYIQDRGTLIVAMENGEWIEQEMGFLLEAAEYLCATDTIAIEITSPCAAWHFGPDKGECERIGMPVKRLTPSEEAGA